MNEKKIPAGKIKAYGLVPIIHENKNQKTKQKKKFRSKRLVQSIMPINKTSLSITFK